MGILDGFASLAADINKSKGRGPSQETEQGVVGTKLKDLELDKDNSEIIATTKKWEKAWNDSEVKAEWEKNSKEYEDYWKGKQFTKPAVDKSRPIVDNAIFESLETWLPQTTRRNPEPMATLAAGEEETDEAIAYTKEVQEALADLADELKIRLKLKKVARNWALHLLGVGKVGWDMDRDIPTLKIIRTKKVILDPEATVDEDGYTGEYGGEYRRMTASKLLSTLESLGGEQEGIEAITNLVGKNLGTKVQFIEWWTAEYMCWTLKDKVLLKKKNPHWNWDTQQPADLDSMGNPQFDAEGQLLMVDVPGVNHFPVPKIPYIFLSVFNLGKQPIDDCSLIGQNLSNQDRINKRVKQIDKYGDGANIGMVVSQERSGLTQAQAKGASTALMKGGTIVIPSGAPRDAIDRLPVPELPAGVVGDLNDTRARLKDIFGTRGSTPSGIESETTVRGKIINRGLDTDRIGGGVSEYLEQFADDVYNWLLQLLYVYDDTWANGAQRPRIRISVKEGSMLPKDSTTLANQAIELASGGKMSLLDLYKALDYPNPEEMAANAWLEVNAPELLYPNDQRVAQAIQARASAAGAAAQKPPSTSISYKDLPPDGQAQLAAQAGIQVDPEGIAAHEQFKEGKKAAAEAAKAAANQLPTPEEMAAE